MDEHNLFSSTLPETNTALDHADQEDKVHFEQKEDVFYKPNTLLTVSKKFTNGGRDKETSIPNIEEENESGTNG